MATVEVAGEIYNVEIFTNGGTVALGQRFAGTNYYWRAMNVWIGDYDITGIVKMCGDSDGQGSNIRVSGYQVPMLQIPGEEQSVSNLVVLKSGVVAGRCIEISGRRNKIDVFLPRVNQDGIDITGDENYIRARMICFPTTDATYHGITCSGNDNDIHLSGKEGAVWRHVDGVRLTGTATDNHVCVNFKNLSGSPLNDLSSGTNTFCVDNTHTHGAGDSLFSVLDDGTLVGSRPAINFHPGTNITLTIADDATNDEVDVTINATTGGDMLKSVYDPTTIEADAFDLQYAHGTLDLGTF